MRIFHEKFSIIAFTVFSLLAFSGIASATLNLSCSSSSLIGDANGDLAINLADVLVMQQVFANGSLAPANTCCIDVNNDTAINALDALMVTSYYNGTGSGYGNVGLLCSDVYGPSNSTNNTTASTGNLTMSGNSGGTLSGTAYDLTLPTTVNISADPLPGYAFSYWTMTGNCSVENATSAITTATLLFGNCNAAAYFDLAPANTTNNTTVSVGSVVVSSSFGGTASGGAANVSLPANVSVLAIPSAGYSFSNWTAIGNCTVGNATAASTFITLYSADCNAYALFSAIPANITGITSVSCSLGSLIGDINGDGYITLQDSMLANAVYVGLIPMPANRCCIDADLTGYINARDGLVIQHYFYGLNGSMYAGRPCSDFYGDFIVSASPSAGGTANGSAYNIIFPATLNVSAAPNAGYAFSGWSLSGNCSAANASSAATSITLLSGSCNASAQFSFNATNATSISCSMSTLIGDVDGDGAITMNDYAIASSVFALLIPAPSNLCCIDADLTGYINARDSLLIGQFAAGTNNSSAVGRPCSDFYGDFIVSASPSAGGTANGSAYNIIFPATLNVSAAPNAGYAFSGWSLSGNCSAANASSAATSITLLSGSCNASAAFTAVPTPPTTPGGSTGSSGGSGGGGSSGSTGGSSTSSTTVYPVDIGNGIICNVAVTRNMLSSETESMMTVTLQNMGGSLCELTDFTFVDTIPEAFASASEVEFSPQYSSRDGAKVKFIFPTFPADESRTLTYTVRRYVPASKARQFGAPELSADKFEPLPAMNATKPAEVPVQTAKPAVKLPVANASSPLPARNETVADAGIFAALSGDIGKVPTAMLAGICLVGAFLLFLLLFVLFGKKKKAEKAPVPAKAVPVAAAKAASTAKKPHAAAMAAKKAALQSYERSRLLAARKAKQVKKTPAKTMAKAKARKATAPSRKAKPKARRRR